MSKRPSRGVTSGVGTPTKMTGRDGDLTIRKTREGKILYVKEHGSWHPINTGVDTVKLKKDVDSLIRSVNTIRNNNNPFLTIDTLNIRRDKIKLGTDGTGLTLKNNSGALNIRNEADSADVQLAVGYGGTGLSTFTGADRIIKSTGATTLAATQTLPSTVQGNITSVGALASGSIASGFGAIDNGSSNITTTGTLSAGTLHASKDFTSISNNSIVKISGTTTTVGNPTSEATINALEIVPIINAVPSSGANTQTFNLIKADLTETSTNSFDVVNLLDIQVTDSGGSKTSKFKINNTGAMTSTGTAAGSAESTVGDTRYLMMNASSGLIGYRTAAQIKGDIGGTSASSTFTDVTINGTDGSTALQITSSADTGDLFKITTNAHGATTIETEDDDATAAHLTLDADGDITLDAASGNIYVKDNGGNYTPGSDYEIATKKYVDDNAGGASALNDLSDVSYSSGDLTISSLDKIVASGSLTLDADVIISKVSDATGTTTNYAQQIDLDHTGNTTSGQTVTNYGLDIDLDVTGNNQGYGSNVNSFGINIAMNADAGTHSAYSGIDNTAIKAVLTGDTTTSSTLQVGYDLTITGGDTGSQTGILINTDNGSTDLKIVSSANTSDYATISTGANGATTIETVDNGGGESADLTLNIDGSLYIDADSGAARLNDGGGTYTPAHDDSLTTKSYVDTKSQNTIIIGGLMPRNVGSAGYHRAVPTSYDVSDLTVGNGTDPTTSLTVSTNGDHANNRLIAFPDDVVVTKCKVSISEGGSTNTTHNIHLMRYDIDADGDWSNGVVVATGTNSNSDDYSQGRFITLTLSGTASNLQVAESNQALVLCVESVDAINLYQNVKAYLKYEWA